MRKNKPRYSGTERDMVVYCSKCGSIIPGRKNYVVNAICFSCKRADNISYQLAWRKKTFANPENRKKELLKEKERLEKRLIAINEKIKQLSSEGI